MHSLDWNDLRYLLAVSEHGSLAKAARALAVHHTTVLRRVGAFEQRAGVRLFERLPSGYVLTAAGEELSSAARRMQDTVANLERRIVGQDLRLRGNVRVTTTDTLASTLMPRALAGFALQHPEVGLEVTTTNVVVSLTKRDADVAVRPSQRPPAHLLGRRIAKIAFAIYAAPSYLERVPAKRDLAKHTWIAPDDSLSGTTIARWMRKELERARVSMRTDSLTALAHAARAGLGISALPCYLADRDPVLQRIRGVIPAMETELWLLTHEDLRGTARVRALTDWLATALGRERNLLEGRER